MGFQLDISMQESNLAVFVETSTQCSVAPKRQGEHTELFGKEQRTNQQALHYALRIKPQRTCIFDIDHNVGHLI